MDNLEMTDWLISYNIITNVVMDAPLGNSEFTTVYFHNYWKLMKTKQKYVIQRPDVIMQ